MRFAVTSSGATRLVFLVGRYAVKLPQLRYGWRNFLHGLLANLQEREFSRAGWPELCPVVFALPLGLLVVMPRAEVLDDGDGRDDAALEAMLSDFCNRPDYVVPAELKADSFGYLGGRLVAIDYGG